MSPNTRQNKELIGRWIAFANSGFVGSFAAFVATQYGSPLLTDDKLISMAKQSSHILDLARRGAEHRYAELKAEIAALVKHFPHLAARKDGHVVHGSAGLWNAVEDTLKLAAGRKKRRKMSAAARKKIGDAQRKRWAKAKAAEK